MLPKNIDLFAEFIDNNKIIKNILKNMPQTQEVWKARKKYLDYINGIITREEIIKILNDLNNF